jgi:hypothetical protein
MAVAQCDKERKGVTLWWEEVTTHAAAIVGSVLEEMCK